MSGGDADSSSGADTTGTVDADRSDGPLDDGCVATADGERVTVDEPIPVWTRWDTAGRELSGNDGLLPIDDLHLHRYCAIPPFDDRTEERVIDDSDEEIRFLTGRIRTGLRHTPVVIAVVMAVLLVGAELTPGVDGVSVFLPRLPLFTVPAAVLFVGVWAILGALLLGAGVLQRDELAKAVVVYGLVAALVAGTLGSLYLVFTASEPSTLPANVVYVSGYLLMLLLGGLLVYDGMLKTEHLFENLDRTLIVDGDDEAAYTAFKRKVRGDLQHETSVPGTGIPVPTYAVFAPLFVAQFAAVWLLQSGPQGLGWNLNLLVNVVLNLFIVVVAFQFLVLIKAFYDLVTGNLTLYYDPETDAVHPEDAEGREPRQYDLLTYRPFHPDGRGGFRDLGKFATRVNVLLIVGGLYTIFRLYVQGGRSPVLTFEATGTASALGLGGDLAPLIWLISYVGPVLAYALAAGAWLYYSFWQLHVKMAREREAQYTEHQYERRKDADTDAPIGDFDDAQQWQELRAAAPVWPIESRQLLSLISGTVVPVLLSFRDFLP